MRDFLNFFLFAALFGGLAYGLVAMDDTRSAIHEILYMIAFLVATVAAVGIRVSRALDALAPKVTPVAVAAPAAKAE